MQCKNKKIRTDKMYSKQYNLFNECVGTTHSSQFTILTRK